MKKRTAEQVERQQKETETYLKATKLSTHNVKVYLKGVPKTQIVEVSKKIGKVESLQSVEVGIKFKNVYTLKNIPTKQIPQAIDFVKNESRGKLTKVIIDNRYIMPIEEK